MERILNLLLKRTSLKELLNRNLKYNFPSYRFQDKRQRLQKRKNENENKMTTYDLKNKDDFDC